MTAPPRLLVVANMRPSAQAPQYGVFVERQVEALRGLGADVAFIGLERSGSGVLATPRKYLRLRSAVRAAVAERRPDAIIAHYLVPTGAIVRPVARRAGIPYVVVAHGGDVTHAERLRPIARAAQRVLADAGAIVAVSDALAHRVAAFAPGRSIEVIDVGVDRRIFRPGAPTLEGAVSPSRPLVVQIGNLIERKNPERLARAVAEVRRRRGGGELWIAGDGPLADRLRDLPHVRLLGAVPADRIPGLLCGADVAALVSLREGYGLGALEAVACGVPLVVARDVPVAADLPASAAVSVDQYSEASIADGIEQALTLVRDDPAGQAVADRHDVDRQAQRLLALVAALARD
jgi:teichuronic acid biosynthesis glycosyltransferase TuaC